jgi:hypothetical protein
MMTVTLFITLYAGGTGFIRSKYWVCSLTMAANRRNVTNDCILCANFWFYYKKPGKLSDTRQEKNFSVSQNI